MSGTTPCPHCDEPVPADARFCEGCGRPTGTEAAQAPVAASSGDDLGSGPISTPTRITAPSDAGEGAAGARRPCLACGGVVGPDGYCELCGTKAASERDHFREQPADWVAGVCDRGLRHDRNEDAMALLASATPGEHAVLVVLDGVSRTDDSHLASLAGARAAREALRTPLPHGLGTPESRRSVVVRAFTQAVAAANDAVAGLTPTGSTAPPSATFVAAIVDGSTAGSTTAVWYANIGDSRAYWLPDDGEGQQLSVDDSAAQMLIEAGVPRKQAESGPQAHAITRWLGIDAPDLTPRVGHLVVDRPGWLLVCSDGLWNYASEPAALAALVRAAATTDPAVLALAFTDFANASGGQDNITTALARLETGQNAAEPPSETQTPMQTPTPMQAQGGSDG